MDNLAKAGYDELVAAPEVGERIAESVVAFFKDPANRKEVERLKRAGLQFQSSEKEPEKISDVLANKSFVISGTFENYERDH